MTPSAAPTVAPTGEAAPPRAPRYRRAGPFVFVAGTAPAGGGEIRAQTAAAIEAMGSVLAEAGGGLENMVEITSYLVNMGDFAGYNDVYSTYFSPDGPARTTVAVHSLGLIELRGTAYIATNGSEK